MPKFANRSVAGRALKPLNASSPGGIWVSSDLTSSSTASSVSFWALDRLTREGTRATLNYLQRLESKGVDYVSYQEQWLDSTGPFKDVMISMFATLAKQERARISERTIAGLRVARAKGKRLGRPPLSKKTIQTVVSLNRETGMGARRIAKSTGFPLGTVSAILSRSRQQAHYKRDRLR